jgi:NADH:ubiquinone oxidoreductase subunit 6 (subunit J)
MTVSYLSMTLYFGTFDEFIISARQSPAYSFSAGPRTPARMPREGGNRVRRPRTPAYARTPADRPAPEHQTVMITKPFVLLLLAIGVSWTRSPFMALMYSVMLFVYSSFVAILLGFDFLALIYLLVYVGALAVLFMFVVMLLEIPAVELRAHGRGYLGLAYVLTIPAVLYGGGELHSYTDFPFAAEDASALGHAFYTHFADLFILNSLILTVALFGALNARPA